MRRSSRRALLGLEPAAGWAAALASAFADYRSVLAEVAPGYDRPRAWGKSVCVTLWEEWRDEVEDEIELLAAFEQLERGEIGAASRALERERYWAPALINAGVVHLGRARVALARTRPLDALDRVSPFEGREPGETARAIALLRARAYGALDAAELASREDEARAFLEKLIARDAPVAREVLELLGGSARAAEWRAIVAKLKAPPP